MTRDERRAWLIEALEREMPEYAEYGVPKGAVAQWSLLRGLFNVRPPMPASEEFLRIEGELLKEMTREKGVVNADALPPCGLDKRLSLWQGDITALQVDAIVNAANSQMLGCWRPGHNCIDNVIHTFAGVELRIRMNEIMEAQGHEEPTGQAKLTPAYNLPSKYVLHTVGPIVMGDLTEEHKALLASCYRSCLTRASEAECVSVAFPCISTGVFMFPQEAAARIAVATVREWLDRHAEASVKKVVFNVFKDEDRAIYERLLK